MTYKRSMVRAYLPEDAILKLRNRVHKRSLILGFTETYSFPVFYLTEDEHKSLLRGLAPSHNPHGRLCFVDLYSPHEISRFRLYWDGMNWNSSLYNQPYRSITRITDYRDGKEISGLPPSRVSEKRRRSF